MKDKCFKFILASLAAFMSFFIFAERNCFSSLTAVRNNGQTNKAPRLILEGYCQNVNTCYADSQKILQIMSMKGVDLDEVTVYYMSNFDGWDKHVVVEYKGHIYDIELINRFDVILPKPIKDYFEGQSLRPDSELRKIPGRDYHDRYSELGNEFYSEGMTKATREKRQKYPTVFLHEFMNELFDN